VRFALALGVALLATAAVAQQPLPIENIQLRGDRFRGLHYRDMTEEQRAIERSTHAASRTTPTRRRSPCSVIAAC